MSKVFLVKYSLTKTNLSKELYFFKSMFLPRIILKNFIIFLLIDENKNDDLVQLVIVHQDMDPID